jgi:hypothetical protein
MRASHVVLLSLVSGFMGGAVGGAVVGRFLPAVDSDAEVAPTVSEPPVTSKLDPSLGSLDLDTLPWSVVFLNGEELGDTPLKGLQLPAGVHRFRFLPQREGTAVFREIEVEAGKTARVKFTLLSGDAAKIPAAAPPKEPASLKPPPPPDLPAPQVVH